MKLIVLTILVAAVAVFVALPAEATHACVQLTVYNTVAEYATQSTNIIDNGDGTVTINQGFSVREKTYTPQLGQGECPPGGDRPAGPLSEANNGPPPTSTTTYTPRQRRPTVVRNAVHDVQATEGDVLNMSFRKFFRGSKPSFTAESSDTTVATVGVSNYRFTLTITATATKADSSVTGNYVLCNGGDSGSLGLPCSRLQMATETYIDEEGVERERQIVIFPGHPEFNYDANDLVHVTLPDERVTTTITMTATNDAGSVSASFDVTVSLDPNRE